jgi:hypothetical protein
MDRILDFIKRYRKFFGIYLVYATGAWILGLTDNQLIYGWTPVDSIILGLAPVFIFILYLAFKES